MSGADIFRFKHNDPDGLAKRLRRLGERARDALIVVEGLYSIRGDCAPLAEYAAVKAEHGGYLFVDDRATISGRAFLDQDADAAFSVCSALVGCDSGVAGVIVRLIDMNGDTVDSTTTDTDPSVTVDNGSSKKSDPVDLGGTDTGDDEPKADKNVVPEPINTGKDAEDGVSVTMVEVTGDYVVARVEGDRTKLYVNIPGAEGVVYVARLAGKCAWMGRIDSDVRVSVCEGKTEQL